MASMFGDGMEGIVSTHDFEDPFADVFSNSVQEESGATPPPAQVSSSEIESYVEELLSLVEISCGGGQPSEEDAHASTQTIWTLHGEPSRNSNTNTMDIDRLGQDEAHTFRDGGALPSAVAPNDQSSNTKDGAVIATQLAESSERSESANQANKKAPVPDETVSEVAAEVLNYTIATATRSGSAPPQIELREGPNAAGVPTVTAVIEESSVPVPDQRPQASTEDQRGTSVVEPSKQPETVNAAPLAPARLRIRPTGRRMKINAQDAIRDAAAPASRIPQADTADLCRVINPLYAGQMQIPALEQEPAPTLNDRAAQAQSRIDLPAPRQIRHEAYEGTRDRDSTAHHDDIVQELLDEGAKWFSERSRAYFDKVNNSTVSQADHLQYLNDQAAEKRRRAALGGGTIGARPRRNHEPSMFVELLDAENRREKRRHDDVEPSEDESDDTAIHSHNMTRAEKKARKASEKVVQRKMVDRGANVLIEKEASKKTSKRKKGERKSSSRKKTTTAAENPVTEGNRKARKAKAPAGPNERPKKGRRRKDTPAVAPGNGNNFYATENVALEANQNLDLPDVPTFNATDKKRAFEQLVASVPLEDQRTASKDKREILRASILLSPRKCRPDGKGGFTLKGMTCALRHFQVLGASWLKQRELEPSGPLGGILADELGMGKTVEMLACMVANPPQDSACQTDLLIASPALLKQWLTEIKQHIHPSCKHLARVQTYSAHAWEGHHLEDAAKSLHLVLTTWGEVRKSFGKTLAPPECVTDEQQLAWWKEEYDKNRGLLHRIQWRRIILDEAHAIKNRNSMTYMAVKALEGRIRWAITGTPALNRPDEFFPYFSWLGAPQAGRYDIFKKNFIDVDTLVANNRIQTFLRQFMVRRTNRDLILGAPILKLPKATQTTIVLDFDPAERFLYCMVEDKYRRRINQWQRRGETECHRRTILTWLLRLRQMCSHPFLIQSELEDLIDTNDVEALWMKTGKAPDMLTKIQKAFSARKDTASGEPVQHESMASDEGANEQEPVVFQFREQLRHLRRSEHWNEALKRSLCTICGQPPNDPRVTDCFHLYCRECLHTHMIEAAADGDDGALCRACDVKFRSTYSCDGVAELQDESVSGSTSGSTRETPQRREKRKDEANVIPNNDKWMSIGGNVLQSSKTAAIVLQIKRWFNENNTTKIIVFSQFSLMILILSRICKEQGWDHVMYTGEMPQNKRAQAVNDFRTGKRCNIMLCGLRCGGQVRPASRVISRSADYYLQGLNLTMASKTILVRTLLLLFKTPFAYLKSLAYCLVDRRVVEQAGRAASFLQDLPYRPRAGG